MAAMNVKYQLFFSAAEIHKTLMKQFGQGFFAFFAEIYLNNPFLKQKQQKMCIKKT